MKFEIPETSGLTIKKYKISFFNKKIKIYYVNKKMNKPITIPYSRVAHTNLAILMENQLNEYVSKSDLMTTSNSKYYLYREFREEFIVNKQEAKVLNIKEMEVNANTIDKYSYRKLEKRLYELRNYRKALQNIIDNGIYLGQQKKYSK